MQNILIIGNIIIDSLKQKPTKTMNTSSLSYFTDIGNSIIFNTPVQFTSKYTSIDHYQKILKDQKNFQNLVYKMISIQQSQSGEIDLPALVLQSGFVQQDGQFIGQVLKNKYSEYKKQIFKRQIYQGGKYLASFNWRVKNIVGCSQFTHKNKVILKLQLYVNQGKKGDEAQVVALQLSISELRELLLKLKKIAKQIKNANY